MAPLHAQGIDGFPTLFYKKYWHVMGVEVIAFCLSLLRGEIIMDTINQTHIVLMLKVSKTVSTH